ncbi:MAG TPA: hypothetical protein VD833_20760 [Vicinamibacterales bacterium]|nr:hypothetical protein [Vicinamibacterales bacterium]
MREITVLSKPTTSRGSWRPWLAATVATGAIAAACSEPAGLTTPSLGPDTTGSAATVLAAEGTIHSWQHFEARGWNCRHPAPGVTVCSPPGQPLPVVAIPPVQPPADRPPTVMLKRWRDGVFDANVLLIRPEIYNDQPCSSTGVAYTYISVLGYFECAHTGGN